MSEEPSASPIARLKKLVIAQKKAFLPPDEEDPSLVPLHQAVSDYDRLVSEVVIRVIQGMPTRMPEKTTREVREQIAGILESPEVQANHKADFYRRYTSRLDEMLKTARQAVQ